MVLLLIKQLHGRTVGRISSYSDALTSCDLSALSSSRVVVVVIDADVNTDVIERNLKLINSFYNSLLS